MSKIIGNTTITPYPKSDWAQTDETKPDFIKNKDLVAGVIVPTVQGADITLNDRGNYPLRNLKIFGHTEQPVPPAHSFDQDTNRTIFTPSYVVSLTSARVLDENGTELIKVDSPLAVEGITGICGIPVKSGGNYTDANKQQWITDYVDFEKGVLVKQVWGRVFDSSEDCSTRWTSVKANSNGTYTHSISDWINYFWGSNQGCYCSHFKTDCGRFLSAKNTFYLNTTVNYGFVTDMPTREEFFNFLDAEKAKGTPVTVWGMRYKDKIEEIKLTSDELNAYKTLAENTSLTHFMNSDGGGLEVTYGADTKKYIDNKFAELSAAIISTGGNV